MAIDKKLIKWYEIKMLFFFNEMRIPEYTGKSWFRKLTYSKALNLAGISTLQDRSSAACHEFIAQLNLDNPVYKLVASRLESTSASAHYSLKLRDTVE